MGKLSSFYIAFANNQNGIFSPGDVITGSVTVELNAPMDMRGKFNLTLALCSEKVLNFGLLSTFCVILIFNLELNVGWTRFVMKQAEFQYCGIK